jgi:hypothetical protein
VNSAEQVVIAGKVGAAFMAARLEVARLKQHSGRAYYPPAEMVDVVRALYRAGFVVREIDAESPPTRPPRLIQFPKDRR